MTGKSLILVLFSLLLVLGVFAVGVATGAVLQGKIRPISPEVVPGPPEFPSSPDQETILKPNNPEAGSGGCFVQNCHGTEVQCGDRGPLMCTMEYRLGDACRKFVSCVRRDGVCQADVVPQFTACVECVQRCAGSGQSNPFECESTCLMQIQQTQEKMMQKTLGVQSPVFVEMGQ